MRPVRSVVLDTNIVLDAFVFTDPATALLRQRLQAGELLWLATPAMREELVRVLDYPQIVRRCQFHGLEARQVLQTFDRQVRLMPVAAKAAWTCKDPDDQKFIDLAAAHASLLLSKDQAVLCMRRRLQQAGVEILSALSPEH